MSEPIFLGYPVSTLFLYFLVYAFAGWAMETVYCSILERRPVSRGFLRGPICPIYGVGVLLMILFFKPLADNIVVFYIVSTVCMSAWEYFVGWFLEVTTHVKYWDYSMYRFNLKGRVCLWVCLVWGVLSYVAIFWLHPPVERALGLLSPAARQITAAVAAVILLTDTVFTVRELALMAKAVARLQQAGDELRLQAALGRMELNDRLDEVRNAVSDHIDGAKEAAGLRIAQVRARYDALLAAAEERSRRFRTVYAQFSVPKFSAQVRRDLLERIRDAAGELKSRTHVK